MYAAMEERHATQVADNYNFGSGKQGPKYPHQLIWVLYSGSACSQTEQYTESAKLDGCCESSVLPYIVAAAKRLHYRGKACKLLHSH